MTKFELWVIGATLAFIPLSIPVVYAYEAYCREHPEPLIDGAKRGRHLALTLKACACEELDLGQMACGRRYVVRYRTKPSWWAVFGPTKTNPKDQTATFSSLPPAPGTISVFGITFGFDNAGKLTLKGKEAGTVAFANR